MQRLPRNLESILAALPDTWSLDSCTGFAQGWVAKLSCEGRHFSVLEDTTRLFVDEDFGGSSRHILRPGHQFETAPQEVARLLVSAFDRPAV